MKSRWTAAVLCWGAAAGAQNVASPPARPPATETRAYGGGLIGPGGEPRWAPVRGPEAIGIGIVGAWSIAATQFYPVPSAPRWSARNALDDAVRGALRASDEGTRTAVSTASTVGAVTLALYPFIDGVVTEGLVHHHGRVALQLSLIAAESAAVDLAAMWAFKAFVGRERPYALNDCSADPAHPDASAASDPLCHDPDLRDHFVSFLSGHSANAFQGAALVCTEHAYLHLYGGGMADVAPCALSLAGATSVGLMRIIADRHWATDVLAGAALGTLTGFVIPAFVHFREHAPLPVSDDDSAHRTAPSAALFVVPWSDGSTAGGLSLGAVM